MLVVSLAYAAEALRRLSAERSARERLAIESERRRIAWELHDSAKQRLHAAHLLVTSLHGRVPESLDAVVSRASVELESAASDMDTSLAELRSPLEGRRLDEALRSRASELGASAHLEIRVSGHAPELPPLVGAHAYRIASEALTNALRHADASLVDVTFTRRNGALRVSVRDNGRGLPAELRPGANGLLAMENRAATIGAKLIIGRPPDGGTQIDLDVPLDHIGGHS
jgi:signal transduction histidine kinase